MHRRDLIGSIAAAILFSGCAPAEATTPADAPPPGQELALELEGAAEQGGMLVGRTLPGSKVLNDIAVAADSQGLFVIGFDHDAPATAKLRVVAPDGKFIERTLNIAPRTYDRTVINGLPQATVTPPPEVLARIRREAALKAAGFASIAPGQGFAQKFIWPVSGRISSNWGAERMLNGVLGRPHYGVDIAAPDGTLIRAPADGVVAFAETGLFYEGGLVMIDHGQGLITVYLHMSKLDVTKGQPVKQGQTIGRVGHEGRATGPHLCWRMKWRGQNLDPSLAVRAFGGPEQPTPLQP